MMMTRKLKSYSELIQLSTFEERFNYLKLNGKVGEATFGFDRVFNQQFYNSKEWKDIRDYVIIRDNACDMGILGREITGSIFIHHINALTLDDILNKTEFLLDPNNLICVSYDTHNAIHYGDISYAKCNEVIERKKDDTCLWKRRF